MEESTLNLPTADEIEALIAQGQLDRLHDLLIDVHPADIADIMDEISTEDAVTIFSILSDETASEVLDETGSLIRQELVEPDILVHRPRFPAGHQAI